MPRFDGELYLRLIGEEMLIAGVDPHRGHMGSAVDMAADALVAAGAVKTRVAEAVLEDYNLAQMLRSGNPIHHRPPSGRRRRTKPKPRAPARVVPCRATLETTSGTLEIHAVVLSADQTTLSITFRAAAAAQVRRRAAFFGPAHTPSPTVVDDQGTNASTDFSGGGSDHEWRGYLTTARPLAADAKWIDVDGARVDLRDEPLPCPVTIEDLPETPPAHRYLWRKLAAPQRFHFDSEQLTPAIEALVAAGALDPEDPTIDHVRAVAEAIPHHPGMMPGAGGPPALPDPWRSLFAGTKRQRGPELRLGVGAVTPVFDGHSALITTLQSDEDGFQIDVDVSPGDVLHGPFHSNLGSSGLVWWAADDRGGHYLGQIGSWSSGPDRGQGEIHFWPALDPKARELRIMPTGETKRAVITVPLPRPGAAELRP